ncbi:hypothetical protein [Methylosinus trichosporium]|uniref:Carboxypeptidase regulatory-like domain-containing protein n=1 Tax=Methylosinus trichosporium (strain ATCC 35070 / NCIMB 11131 / UNIQEM 75 / OB3b) TaxID=595536 RepID=A0A2D2D0G9_METT3|nr:hypothetical protein [Methylosinus trichosporium]ATQ68369.1 hypothetical protein CQW49_11115 [Methylosinus trichosporium OB3b]
MRFVLAGAARPSVALFAGALCACQSAAPPPPQGRFDPAEAAFIRREGETALKGQAFLRDPHGRVDVRYASGEVVRLIPATAYARARFAQFYGDKKFVPAQQAQSPTHDPDYLSFMRTTKADATGRFVFDKLAPGRYFVATQLTWTPAGRWLSEGGAMYDEVEVTGKESEPIRMILSGN